MLCPQCKPIMARHVHPFLYLYSNMQERIKTDSSRNQSISASLNTGTITFICQIDIPKKTQNYPRITLPKKSTSVCDPIDKFLLTTTSAS